MQKYIALAILLAGSFIGMMLGYINYMSTQKRAWAAKGASLTEMQAFQVRLSDAMTNYWYGFAAGILLICLVLGVLFSSLSPDRD